jgi:hypothetical protein
MNLELSPESVVFVDLRATGLLRAMAHDPTLRVRPPSLSLTLPDDRHVDVTVEARFAADAIEPPADLPASDREKMLDNLRGRDVLDVARHPRVEFRGRYRGDLERGELSGEVVVRGQAHALAMPIQVSREGRDLVARGSWEGKLTHLGVRPFKALLGALRLDDWARLRVETRWVER